ncbi:hypothetical protein PVAND_014534 [Polypedilum vanderplanki]|uniref:Uncharacterized protein n=1 Tax=Polypedilum vanderplanki TaxID=319348 RepID=A0A9J6B9G6_POLVA|nr:hypothetical protein PVAND_014534 [Polypedilum vanderplanki]
MKNSIWLVIFIISGNFYCSISFTLVCEFRLSSLKTIGQIYECFSDKVPTKSGYNVTKISGIHSGGKKNEHVTSVFIVGSDALIFFPRQISKFFPNLVSFQLFSTSIEILNGDELDEFGEKLKYFVLTFSKLKTISSHLFLKTPNVIFIWFQYNKITQVGHDLLTPFNLTRLQQVDFDNNNCISKNSRNNGILELQIELRTSCRYDNEPTTTTVLTTPCTICTTTKYEGRNCFYWDRKSRRKKFKNDL